MVYTVTINPSVDYIMKMDKFSEGMVNRSEYEKVFIGGKGINVSYVLEELGTKSIVLGFTAGFTGKYIMETLEKMGLSHDLIELDEGMSRINVKLKGYAETEINGSGPYISPEDVEKLVDMTEKTEQGDFLVLSGSVPSSVDRSIYKTIMSRIQDKKVSVVVDATGNLLTDTLDYHPYMIKPNIHELSELYGRQIESIEDVVFYSKKLIKDGAENVIVSMGGKGAVLVNSQSYRYKEARKGNAVNTTGAGDSMVAGFVHGCIQKMGLEKAFAFAVETGTIAAFSEGLPVRDDLKKILI